MSGITDHLVCHVIKSKLDEYLYNESKESKESDRYLYGNPNILSDFARRHKEKDIKITDPVFVIIPMSGLGKRFQDAGINVYKALINLDAKSYNENGETEIINQSVLFHILDSYKTLSNKKFVFLINENHTEILTEINKYCNKTTIDFIACYLSKGQGPVDTIVQFFEKYPEYKTVTNKVIVNYCDFGTYNIDFNDLINTNDDGRIVCYTGFHPHMLGKDEYAYCDVNPYSNLVMYVREKYRCHTINLIDKSKGLTDDNIIKTYTDKQSEYTSNGIYYFKSMALLYEYSLLHINNPINKINEEYYVSTVYNDLVANNKHVTVYMSDYMLQWGTPHDIKMYNTWRNWFKNTTPKIHQADIYQSDYLIVPMAGKGSRFSECKDKNGKQEFALPKPLLPIKINGKDTPMVIAATKCLPNSKNVCYIGLKEHFPDYSDAYMSMMNVVNIRKDIQDCYSKCLSNTQQKKYFSEPFLSMTQQMDKKTENQTNCEIITIDQVTDGQSTTCMKKVEYLPDDASITITACDNGCIYDYDVCNKLYQECDIVVYSFNNNPTAELYPQMYAWLHVDDNGNLKQVSNKKKFSDESKNNQCIIGTMFFKKAKYFKQGYKYIKDNNIKTNNEYYVDDMLNYLISQGLKIKTLLVDQYLCWGTPNDYKTFKYWEKYYDC